MNIPSDLKYTKDHEWVKKIDDKHVAVGITDYAQGELGDIVYVEIESQGENLESGEAFGSVEAVKTVSDLFMPIGGEVTEVNEGIDDDPSVLNNDPYGNGWLIKIKMSNPGDLDKLLSASDYEELVS